ncbi:MAG: aldo/keto reductase [Spirochaetales bacterium]|nr:aldo/keto reductase [Spirochaetales bacterium]
MIYREYGSTGKRCSVLGFGGMRFQAVDDREACVQMMTEAARGGVNYFDTAPAYFGVKSEQAFGEGFKELRRLGLPFYCATKTFESTEAGIRREIEKQLRRLNLEAIDFYHVWCIVTLENWAARKQKGVIQAFQKLKEEGLIRHICVSSHLIGDQIKELLAEEVFEGVLFGYSAYNFSIRQKAFETIAARNLGCVVMNPLGGGLIPQNPEVFAFIKSSPEQTVVEAALHFLFSHERITTALVGFGNLEEVREALRAVESYQGVDSEHVERIKQSISEAFLDLCTGCQYCDHCPEGIPIPKLMDAYNHMKLYGSKDKLLERLKMHWNISPEAAAACTECGQCEEACTQHLPIIQRLKEIVALGRPA